VRRRIWRGEIDCYFGWPGGHATAFRRFFASHSGAELIPFRHSGSLLGQVVPTVVVLGAEVLKSVVSESDRGSHGASFMTQALGQLIVWKEIEWRQQREAVPVHHDKPRTS
jgi:hypothetical protein